MPPKTYQIVLLAVNPAVNVVEGLSAQRTTTGATDEAVGVVQVPHGLAGRSGAGNFLLARVTNSCKGFPKVRSGLRNDSSKTYQSIHPALRSFPFLPPAGGSSPRSSALPPWVRLGVAASRCTAASSWLDLNRIRGRLVFVSDDF